MFAELEQLKKSSVSYETPTAKSSTYEVIAMWEARAAIAPWLSVLTVVLRSVLIVVRGLAVSRSAIPAADEHVASFCEKKPVQNDPQPLSAAFRCIPGIPW
jgi:hypothetical protein